MPNHQDSVLSFPCDFPIKIMGKANDEFEATALSIVRKHYPQLKEHAIRQKLSADGNYLALTVTITAHSQQQLDAIYQDLTKHEAILVAL